MFGVTAKRGLSGHWIHIAVLLFPAISKSLANPLGPISAPRSIQTTGHGQASTLEARAEDKSAGWGLACLSEKEPSGDQNPNDSTYHYLDNSGAGVDVYMLDTGVNQINAFGSPSRLVYHKDYTGTGPGDGYSHGTKMAALVGSDKYGAAKKPNLLSYKIMQDLAQFRWRGLLRALRDIQQSDRDRKQKDGYRGSVILMAFGYTSNDPLIADIEAEMKKAYDQSITLVASAGNANDDSENYFPCNLDFVICVGAIDEDYRKPSYANWGLGIDILAPGDDVETYKEDGTHDFVGGTSAAAAYVAGVVSIFKGYEGPDVTNERIEDLLYEKNAQKGVCKNPGRDTDNRLANTGYLKHAPYVDAPDRPASVAQTTATTTASATTSTNATTSITSCSSQDLPETTIGGQYYPASSQCACDGGAIAGLDYVSGTSGTSYLRCGISTDYYLSTIPPTTPSTTEAPTTTEAPPKTITSLSTSCKPNVANGARPFCYTHTTMITAV